jgi:hypothetical protein
MTSHSLLFRLRVAGPVRDIRGKNPQEDRAPGGLAIGETDRPEDLSEQSFDCDPPDRQSETSLADLDAR